MRSKFIIVSTIAAFVAFLSLVNILFAGSLTFVDQSNSLKDRANINIHDDIASFFMDSNADNLMGGDPSPVFSTTLEGVDFSTQYEIFNPSTTETGTSVHQFNKANGLIINSVPYLTEPEQVTLVKASDHTYAGYTGDVVISADFPFTITLITFPTAYFSIQNIDDLTVTYSNFSTGHNHVLWDFGDGITSTVDSPVHTYAYPGEFLTTLKVTKLNCSISIPECVSEYSEVVDLIKEKVFLPFIVND